MANTDIVVRITSTFSASQRKAVIRCVTTMCKGMPEFQDHNTLDGLPGLVDLDRYCYFVAGIVGEMLTDLFCEHCDELAERRDEMMALAVCFGQGLQMTNILKDIWEDQGIQVPAGFREAFSPTSTVDFLQAMRESKQQAITEGVEELVGIAHAQLKAALEIYAVNPEERARNPTLLPMGNWHGRY